MNWCTIAASLWRPPKTSISQVTDKPAAVVLPIGVEVSWLMEGKGICVGIGKGTGSVGRFKVD